MESTAVMNDRAVAAAKIDNSAMLFTDEDNIEDMYLTFGLGAEEYGIGIVYVTEVVGMQRIMEVPDVPGFIKGVINLRGKVIPVMDVRVRFGMELKDYNERTVIIVLDVDKIPVGLVVDFVSEVLEIPPEKIESTHQYSKEDSGVIRGFGKTDDRVAVLLNVERLVSRQAIDLKRIAEAA